jgi:hypothetical protein
LRDWKVLPASLARSSSSRNGAVLYRSKHRVAASEFFSAIFLRNYSLEFDDGGLDQQPAG